MECIASKSTIGQLNSLWTCMIIGEANSLSSETLALLSSYNSAHLALS